MDQRLESAIKNRTGQIVSLQMAWKQAVEQLLSAGAAADDALPLIKAAPEPATLRRLARMLGHDQHPRHALEQLFDAVDASSENLATWLKGLAVLQLWLENEGRATTLQQATGYVECSNAANEMQVTKLELDAMVESMLEAYGYSGDDPSQNCL
ncbi:MAG: hypothetical protein Q7P63_08765 [Verrucomicrobiota bacterium JB022]|nr:hypothetical protein [Verrucomicrobiota bacterium JB022]